MFSVNSKGGIERKDCPDASIQQLYGKQSSAHSILERCNCLPQAVMRPLSACIDAWWPPQLPVPTQWYLFHPATCIQTCALIDFNTCSIKFRSLESRSIVWYWDFQSVSLSLHFNNNPSLDVVETCAKNTSSFIWNQLLATLVILKSYSNTKDDYPLLSVIHCWSLNNHTCAHGTYAHM